MLKRPNIKKPAISEGTIQLQILKYLKALGIVCGKTKTMGVGNPDGSYRHDFYCFRGFPDLTAFTPELMFIEVKTEKGKQSEAQKDFQDLCIKGNVKYVLARSADDVIEALKTI